MFKKLFLVVAVLLVNITGISSCIGGAGTCIGVEPPTTCIKMNQLDLLPINNNSGLHLSANDTVFYNELTIELHGMVAERSCYRRVESWLGTSVYACSQDINYIVEDSVRSINITANADFDSNHPAGSSLNDLFSFSDINFLNRPIQYDHFDISLTAAPKQTTPLAFTVAIKLASGSVVKGTAVPLVVSR